MQLDQKKCLIKELVMRVQEMIELQVDVEESVVEGNVSMKEFGELS